MNTLPVWVLATTAVLLTVAVVICGIRIARGPHAADRVVALDMLGLLGVAATALAALVVDNMAFVDIALGVALISFLATVAFATLIERGSSQEEDSS